MLPFFVTEHPERFVHDEVTHQVKAVPVEEVTHSRRSTSNCVSLDILAEDVGMLEGFIGVRLQGLSARCGRLVSLHQSQLVTILRSMMLITHLD